MSNTGEKTRFGCKYADQYYAGQFNISEEEAKEVYVCQTDVFHSEPIPDCPFGFLPDCLLVMNKPDNYRQGVVAGLLGNIVNACKLIPYDYSGQPRYECSSCGGVIKGGTEFMDFCYHCGTRIGG
ncbi:hypothetical protein LCGC14_0396340 [marine sediment metagenome]|uniref:Uncharacterized protein n=1 Tax=marine sediment metagenome TaxID=412755 RepID=A0A0F9TG39_9ZZZZ